MARVVENWPAGHEIYLAQAEDLDMEDDHTSVFEYSSYETSLLETISGISSFLFRPFLNRNLFVVFLLCPNKFSEKFFALSATEGRVSDSISEGNNPPAEVRNLSRRDALRQESSTRQGISKIITP